MASRTFRIVYELLKQHYYVDRRSFRISDVNEHNEKKVYQLPIFNPKMTKTFDYDIFFARNETHYDHRIALLEEALRRQEQLKVVDEVVKNNNPEGVLPLIKNSKKVLVFITAENVKCLSMNRDDEAINHAKTEFVYACAKRGINNIIPVIMEEEFLDPRSWNK